MIIEVEDRFCKVAKAFSEVLSKSSARPNGAMRCMSRGDDVGAA
jgi:hypothetical protein